MKKKVIKILLLLVFAAFSVVNMFAQSNRNREVEAIKKLAAYNVVWNSPSLNSKGSMPLGNGDIGVNVWVEQNGDLMMYLAKTDAWSEDVFGTEGLLKLGRLRVHFSNNPFKEGKPFLQTLLLAKGTIEIKADDNIITVWVDANHPLVYVESNSTTANTITVNFESLRSHEALAAKDTVLKSVLHNDNIFDNQPNQIAWLYENNNQKISALKNLKFGAIVSGDGFINQSATTLVSSKPQTKQTIAIAAYTGKESNANEWLRVTQKLVPTLNNLSKNKLAHENWWQQFWQRSWIFLDGDKNAELVSRTYNLQRFLSACGARGAYPAKFNGSLFTMDDTLLMKKNGVNAPVAVNADFRSWGGRYWFQNTRHQYWQMLAAGDFEMMQPFFNLYINQIENNKAIIQKMYGFNGLIFGEQQPFWGGLPNGTDAGVGGYGYHYFSQVMELTAMMLDYYSYTGDTKFLKEKILSTANDGLQFYLNRFKKDSTGKLVFDPANAMETFWKVKNPSSEIAGFRYVLQRLLQLPETLVGNNKKQWQAYLNIAPNIPVGTKENVPVILASETLDAKSHNTENPELYTIFPFRLYGINKPNLDIAKNTFDKRINKRVGCWHHDVLSAALLGKTDDAMAELVKSCTYTNAIDSKNNNFRFIGFLGPGHDYAPDLDHGGIIMLALQYMLLQSEGDKIQLLPAFPRRWNVDFKLYASNKKTVTAQWQDGKMLNSSITTNY
jgi:hypothetical protein